MAATTLSVTKTSRNARELPNQHIRSPNLIEHTLAEESASGEFQPSLVYKKRHCQL
jgi:hypothetical protein